MMIIIKIIKVKIIKAKIIIMKKIIKIEIINEENESQIKILNESKQDIIKNYEKQINAMPIIYPAVNEKSSRIRFFLSATHTKEDMDKTLDVLSEIFKK
mgnify:CR=1 FL=1